MSHIFTAPPPSRRTFLQSMAMLVTVTPGQRPADVSGVDVWRSQFPALGQRINGRPLVYLDTAATALRPTAVTAAITDYYHTANANPGHGGTLHTLARRSGERYEEARQTVAKFINARDPSEIVWTRGTTDAINLAASSWGLANLAKDDEILLTVAEHYSNLLPWQAVARRTGAVLRFLDVDDAGRLRIADLDRLLTKRTKLVAFSHVSNVLGIVCDAAQICRRAHAAGAKVLVDGAQSAPHIAIDVQALECDFFAFSCHKMWGPMGTGVLWARRAILDAMPPYQTGANMAEDVGADSARVLDVPFKFHAGSANVSGPVGLAAAVRFFDGVGRRDVLAHEQALTRHALARLSATKGVRILGAAEPPERVSLLTFVIDGLSPPDVVRGLDAEGIAVRAGDMAALPLLKRFGVSSAVRVSMSLYNTIGEIDRFADALDALPRTRR
jgi:cysteine desulfurase/selenocysteine lyase